MAERYNTPQQGAVDWHIPLNENFESLDADVELRDAETALSEYTPVAGAKFIATDTGRRYVGDGSTWNEIPVSVPSVSSDPSDPSLGQLWYNTSDDALRVNTSSGVTDVVSVSGNDSGDDGSDDTSSSGYFDGATLYSSDFSSLQAAVDAASARDRLLVDTDHTVSSTVSLKSDLLVRGDGGTIRAADGTNQDVLRTDTVQNVWIDGVTIDGGWGGPNSDANVGVRLIGGVNVGSVSNLRVTNCTLRSSGLNAIELVDKQGGELTDIYIGDNTISQSRNHGIILGVKVQAGSLHDAVIENNRIEDTWHAQGIGAFGQDPAEEYNIAVLGNVLDNTGISDENGTNLAFEERADNNIAYGNEVIGNTSSSKGGIGATKDADNNIIGNNRVSQTGRSLQVQNFNYFEPEGPPRYNLVIRNYVYSGSNGFYFDGLDGDLHVSDNLFEDVGTEVADSGDNSGSNYIFYNNGSGVPSSTSGLPDSIGSSVTYSDADGNIVGSASWDRGSVDPNDSVSVSVSTSV